MADVEVYGAPISNYVRAVRVACFEKGIDYEFDPERYKSREDFRSDAHLRLHPFGKMPAFRHGDYVIFETLAILHYIDEAFDGPALRPADLVGRTQVLQWCSSAVDYIYGAAMRSYVIPIFFGGVAPEDLADALPRLKEVTAIVDEAYSESPFLVGGQFSLADMIVLPIFTALSRFGDGPELIAKNASLAEALAAFHKRPSVLALSNKS